MLYFSPPINNSNRQQVSISCGNQRSAFTSLRDRITHRNKINFMISNVSMISVDPDWTIHLLPEKVGALNNIVWHTMRHPIPLSCRGLTAGQEELTMYHGVPAYNTYHDKGGILGFIWDHIFVQAKPLSDVKSKQQQQRPQQHPQQPSSTASPTFNNNMTSEKKRIGAIVA